MAENESNESITYKRSRRIFRIFAHRVGFCESNNLVSDVCSSNTKRITCFEVIYSRRASVILNENTKLPHLSARKQWNITIDSNWSLNSYMGRVEWLKL